MATSAGRSLGGQTRYSDDDRAAYIDLALRVGIAPAIDRLGYPGSVQTANRWVRAAGHDLPATDTVKQQARQRSDWYTALEQKRTAAGILEALERRLTSDLVAAHPHTGETYVVPLAGAELAQLARAAELTVRTLRLIEGKPTEVLGLDDGPRALVDKAIAAATHVLNR